MKMPDQHKRVIIAGGKTGGHLFPGIAVAQALLAEAPDTRILFVGTDAPFEVQTLEAYGFAHQSIISKPIKGGSLISKAWSAALVSISIVQALWIITRFRADFILGVGGFSSFALVLAARLLGRATAIQEQNAIPGMTNRMLSRFARTIFTAFQETRGMSLNRKTFWVGNPVRLWTPDEKSEARPDKKGSAGEAAGTEDSETAFLKDLSETDFLILVTGGSQGAASINRAVIGAAAMLQERKNIFMVHQTGRQGEAEAVAAYNGMEIRVKAQAFFQNIQAIQKRADLVIARAGAGTLSELAALGKAAVLIPYPHAADDHQTANARNLSDRGAAILIADSDLTPELLCQTIQALIDTPDKRQALSDAITPLAMPDAARIIAGHILGHAPAGQKGEN